MADLTQLQQRFYDRVVHHQAEGDLIGSGEVGIYARMYASRLYDTLAEDYPKLRVALGEERFDDVVLGFLRMHPPSSFTLRDAGLALPSFLRDAQEAPAWAADLAALERARIEVFDGPDATPLTQDEAAALGDDLPGLMLAWVPSSVVVSLAWSADDVWSAIEDGEPFSEPTPDARVVLVWRRDVAVLHRTLDPDEGRLAPQISSGVRFSDLCDVLGAIHGDGASGRAVELLLRWLTAAVLDASPPRT